MADGPNFASLDAGDQGLTAPKNEALPYRLPLAGLEEADEFDAFLSDPLKCTERLRKRYVNINLNIPMYIPVGSLIVQYYNVLGKKNMQSFKPGGLLSRSDS